MKPQTKASEGAKHTPGPWRYDFLDDDHGWILDADGNYLAEMVTSDDEGLFKPDDIVGNAKLIAAAPETAAERDRLKEVNAQLLEALNAVDVATDERVNNASNGKALRDALVLVRQAIKAASEGRAE